MSTPAMQMNPNAIMALQGHIQEHIGLMAENMAREELMQGIPPEAMQDPQQSQMIMQQMQPQIDQMAAQTIAELTEQFAQAVTPPPAGDPLVDIRNQELQIKAMDSQRKGDEFQQKQKMEQEQERNDTLIAQQRIDIQENALSDKTRIAENRIRTQREIAVLNARSKGQRP
tara:strand:- start:270 stop:782 length:513 start_codon:yes stop_codon:yes gene_type:complete